MYVIYIYEYMILEYPLNFYSFSIYELARMYYHESISAVFRYTVYIHTINMLLLLILFTIITNFNLFVLMSAWVHVARHASIILSPK